MIKIKKYGDKNYNNPIKHEETCLKKYGVSNVMQNIEIFNKNQISGLKIKKYENLTYQGEYELDFLEKYHNINIEKGPRVDYFYENILNF